MTDPGWHRVGALAEVERAGCKLYRKDGRQIAVFNTPQGLFACDNRCPHEGYPLKEGTLDERCVLTCNWHNWKFDLSTGDNLYGGDRLRTYPVEVRGGEVWIDLTDPPFEERYRRIMHSLGEAFDDNAYERMGRELARLSLLGADPVDAVREAIGWSFERMEFGWTHAFAAAADWLTLYDENEGDEETRLVCLLEIVAHLADDVLRERTYPFPDGQSRYDEDGFVAAIENEDESRAIAMLRGALSDGLGYEGLERGLARAALAHYNDFGHALIYTVKAGGLIERLGDDTALPLLLALVRTMVYATREDLIPEFRRYSEMLAKWGGENVSDPPAAEDYAGLSINNAMALAVDHSAAPEHAQYSALLGANARNMLSFDLYYQEQTTRPVQDNVGWLDFTHGLTFANAVRRVCGNYPELWPAGLLQLACFCGRNAPYTDGSQDFTRWQVSDPALFMENTIGALYDHGREEFIVSVHLLKTALAVRDEIAAGVDTEVRSVMLAALNRFLGEPLKLKHARRTARQSISFVARDG